MASQKPGADSRREPVPSPLAADMRGMERLVIAVQELSLARDLETVQRIVRSAARALTGADGATFVLRDGDQCFYVDEDAIGPLWKGRRFPMDDCISGWVMLHRRPTSIPDIEQDPRVPAEAYRPTFVKSLLMVPIRTLAPVGAIGNYWATPHTPLEREVSLLQALADSTAVALENIQLSQELDKRLRLSLSDELTGLCNRRGFNVLAEQVIRAAHRGHRPVVAIFADLDGLKQVNDRLGHEVGDAMIVDMARALSSSFRGSDVIARLGGDEFCVLTLDSDADAEVLRQRLQARMNAIGAGRPYCLAASIGIVTSSDENEALDSLLARADQAMYFEKRAKGGGRMSAAAAMA